MKSFARKRKRSTASRTTVKLPRDWQEFVDLLVAHRVRFLIVGAHALAALGRPRYTGDFDVLVNPTPANAKRVCAVLSQFGFGLMADEQFFSKPDVDVAGVSMGVPPRRLDVLKSIDGVTFAEAWRRRKKANIGGHRVNVIGKAAYLKNKRISGRPKDLLDIALLEEIEPEKRNRFRRKKS